MKRWRVRAVNVSGPYVRRGLIPPTTYHRWRWVADIRCALNTVEMDGIVADFVVEQVADR